MVVYYPTRRAARRGNCAQNCLTMQRYASPAGQLMKTVDAKLGTTRYWHDAAGRPVAIEDAKGSVARATYDGFGRRTQSIDPNQGTWNFTYDGYGQVLTQTDARGIIPNDEALDLTGRIVGSGSN